MNEDWPKPKPVEWEFDNVPEMDKDGKMLPFIPLVDGVPNEQSIRRTFPELIQCDAVQDHPLGDPVGLMFVTKYTYGDEIDRICGVCNHAWHDSPWARCPSCEKIKHDAWLLTPDGIRITALEEEERKRREENGYTDWMDIEY